MKHWSKNTERMQKKQCSNRKYSKKRKITQNCREKKELGKKL